MYDDQTCYRCVRHIHIIRQTSTPLISLLYKPIPIEIVFLHLWKTSSSKRKKIQKSVAEAIHKYNIKEKNHNNCPLTQALLVIGGKWKPIIISHLRKSPKRFGQLKALIPKTSRKVLTTQL